MIYLAHHGKNINHLSLVFKRLKKADLKFKWSMCQFFKRSLHYLGHAILDEGIRPCPEKTEAVQVLTPPTNIDEVHPFLGQAWQDITSNSFIICRYCQVPKQSVVQEDSLCMIRRMSILFQTTKGNPMQLYPDLAKLYVLFCDASNYAFVGVITHTHENSKDLRPIANTFGSFSPVQQCWCATEKEYYAIYQSILKFDFYLWGSTCTLRCNHKPLEPFLMSGMKIQKLHRQALELLDCNLNFVHTKETTIY